MIAFASFAQPPQDAIFPRHHPDVVDDMDVDLGEDDFERGYQRLTCPGEPITSSQAFMR